MGLPPFKLYRFDVTPDILSDEAILGLVDAKINMADATWYVDSAQRESESVANLVLKPA